MTTGPLIAIGLDAMDYRQIEVWMREGELPVMAAIRDKGAYGRLKGPDSFVSETPWTNFLTGVFAEKTGYWGVFKYNAATYDVKEEQVSCYRFDEYKPFYALHGKKVAIFDLPHIQLIPGLSGIQVMAWGAHSPLSNSGSMPQGLLREIEDRYGKHPTLRSDHNDWWVRESYPAYRNKLFTGIERRGAICHDLLKREPWDLFITAFGETHAVGHDYYFTSRSDHPLAKFRKEIGVGEDAPLEICRKIDAAIGKILSAAPENARVVIFSLHGMRANQNDLPSLVFLAELLQRKHFPKNGFFDSPPFSEEPGPLIVKPQKKGWVPEMWRLKKERGPLKTLLKKILPHAVLAQADKILRTTEGSTFSVPYHLYGYLAAQPATWYKPFWPKMRYFALPSYGDGQIRINLKGREKQGMVEAGDYGKVCDEIEDFLSKTRSARTGSPLLKKVLRTRKNPLDADPKLPAADLVVLWNDEPVDAVDHPEAGRIGPLPFSRPGGHIWLGFYMAAGSGISAGRFPGAEDSIHLTSTLMHHLGCSPPDYMDARKVLF